MYHILQLNFVAIIDEWYLKSCYRTLASLEGKVISLFKMIYIYFFPIHFLSTFYSVSKLVCTEFFQMTNVLCMVLTYTNYMNTIKN